MVGFLLALHPLLSSQVRNKCTSIPSLDADLLQGRPDDCDGLAGRHRALEVRRILGHLLHESCRRLQLLWWNCGYSVLGATTTQTNLKNRGTDTYHCRNDPHPLLLG